MDTNQLLNRDSTHLASTSSSRYILPEILDLIVKEIGPYYPDYFLHKSRTSDFYNFSLVCKDWYYAVGKSIWKRITVKDDKKIEFMTSMFNEGEGSKWIKELRIKASITPRVSLNGLNQEEDTIRPITSESFENLLNLVPRLTLLSFTELNSSTCEFTVKILSKSPNIHTLKLTLPINDFSFRRLPILTCPILRSLTIDLHSPPNLLDTSIPILPLYSLVKLEKLYISVNVSDVNMNEPLDYSEIIYLLNSSTSTLTHLEISMSHDERGNDINFDYQILQPVLKKLSNLIIVSIDFESTPIDLLHQIPSSISALEIGSLSTAQLQYLKDHPTIKLNLEYIYLANTEPILMELIPPSVVHISFIELNNVEEFFDALKASIESGVKHWFSRITIWDCCRTNPDFYEYSSEDVDNLVSKFLELDIDLNIEGAYF